VSTLLTRRTEKLVKDNADDVRSDRGERGVRLRIAHAKAAKGGKVCEELLLSTLILT